MVLVYLLNFIWSFRLS